MYYFLKKGELGGISIFYHGDVRLKKNIIQLDSGKIKEIPADEGYLKKYSP
jgi:hypothetical protein